jgi:hypothetical protein
MIEANAAPAHDVHPRTVQSETPRVLLRLFVVTGEPPPAA